MDDDETMWRLAFGEDPPKLSPPATREEWDELYATTREEWDELYAAFPTREEQEGMMCNLFPRPADTEIIEFPRRDRARGK